jgi:hypothetical protein
MHTRARKLIPILSHLNPLHIFTSYFFKTYFNIICICKLIPFKCSPTQKKIMYLFVISLTRAKIPVHIIFLDWIILVIIGEEREL